MALQFNGTTISTSTPNVLKFNGNNVTSVFFNGYEAWKQVLFSASWSGNSVHSATEGFETSGSLFRIRGSEAMGAWLTANGDATFQNGTSKGTYSFGYYNQISSGGADASNAFSIRFRTDAGAGTGLISYTIANGFYSSTQVGQRGLVSSGGKMAYRTSTGTTYTFITLT